MGFPKIIIISSSPFQYLRLLNDAKKWVAAHWHRPSTGFAKADPKWHVSNGTLVFLGDGKNPQFSWGRFS